MERKEASGYQKKIGIKMKKVVFVLLMMMVSIVLADNAKADNVTVTTAGTLSSKLSNTATSATITGPLNGTDFKYLRELVSTKSLSSIDLTNVQIVAGGVAYDGTHYTEDNVFGEEVFFNGESNANGFNRLKSIKLPTSITKIGKSAVARCNGITEIVIPDKVEEVGMDAFAYMTGLSTVTIGEGVKKMYQGVFYGSTNLTSAYIKCITPPTLEGYTDYLFYMETSANRKLYVSRSTINQFRNADWGRYGTLVGYYGELTLTDIFEDELCTVLKTEYQNMTDGNLSGLLTDLGYDTSVVAFVLKIKNNTWEEYEKQFRVNEFKPYSDALTWHSKAMNNGFSYMGNPTGIYASENGKMYVFVEGNVPSNATLYMAGCTDNNLVRSSTQGVKLKRGLNVVSVYKNAYQYIVYTVDTKDMTRKVTDFPNIRIHIEGGVVNGYYDNTHQNDAEYRALLNKATGFYFTVKGERCVYNFYTSSYREHWPNSIDSSIKYYDRLVEDELSLMGICTKVKNGEKNIEPYFLTGGDAFYPEYVNNPFFAIQGKEGDSGTANSSDFRVSYNSASVVYKSLDYDSPDFDLWCAAHENGHNSQKAMKFRGLTEVTNNLFSNYMCFTDGKRITAGSPVFVTNHDHMTHKSWFERDIWSTTRMFYQLYLYYHQAKRNTSFYPNLFKALREDKLGYDGDANTTSLKLVRKICEVANEDLTDYFRLWGFFEPFDGMVSDYGTVRQYVYQKDIDNTLAEIAKYPVKNRDIIFIEDRVEAMKQGSRHDPSKDRVVYDFVSDCSNHGQFTDYLKTNVGPGQYYHVQTDSLFRMIGDGGIGFFVTDDEGNMLAASNSNNFVLTKEIIKRDYNIYSYGIGGNLKIIPFKHSGRLEVNVSTPGTLSSFIKDGYNYLIVKGRINGTDLQTLHDIVTNGTFTGLDLSEADIVSSASSTANTIPSGLFTCTSLLEIILPNSLTTIGSNAFSHCDCLTSVVIPDNVTVVGGDAFAYCKILANVTIGKNVKTMNQGVFFGSNVKNAYVKATTPPSIYLYLFSTNPTIHVYPSSYSSYKYQSGSNKWSSFGTIVGDLEDEDIDTGDKIMLTVSTVNYSTFYNSQYAVKLPAGMKGYVAKFNNGELVLAEAYNGDGANNVVPAGEPIVINALAGDYPLYITSTSTSTYKSRGLNVLEGTDVETNLATLPNASDYYFYALSINQASGRTTPGFYWMNNDGAPFVNGASKAYLKVAKTMQTNNAKELGFPIVDEETTGIENLDMDAVAGDKTYNTIGQRVKANAKGIVIVNGKKFVNK